MISPLPLNDRLPRLQVMPCCAVGGLLLTLAVFLLAGTYPTFPGDRSLLEGVQGNQSGWLDSAALAVTKIAGWAVAGVLIAGVAVCLALGRRRIDATIVLLSAAPMLVVFLLKELVGRARPEYFLTGAEPSSMSFPSGHSVFAIIFGGLLIFLMEQLIQPLGIRRALQIGVGLLIVAIGASRVYLGVHWPSDVLGGYLFGAMALLGLFWLRNRLVLWRSGASKATS